MEHKRMAIFLSALIFCAGLFSGCATIQEPIEQSNDPAALKETLKSKDAKLKNLEEIIDDQQLQLKELNEKLEECESNKKEEQINAAADKS